MATSGTTPADNRDGCRSALDRRWNGDGRHGNSRTQKSSTQQRLPGGIGHASSKLGQRTPQNSYRKNTRLFGSPDEWHGREGSTIGAPSLLKADFRWIWSNGCSVEMVSISTAFGDRGLIRLTPSSAAVFQESCDLAAEPGPAHETVTSRSMRSTGRYSRATTMRSGCPFGLGNSSRMLNLLSWCVGSSTHSMLYR